MSRLCFDLTSEWSPSRNMDSDCLELRCPLTECRKKLRGAASRVVVRLHRHLVLEHKVLQANDQCPICKSVYSSRWYTRRHVQTVHLEPKSTRVINHDTDYIEMYKCKQCGKKLTKKSQMLRHVQSHMKMVYHKPTNVTAGARDYGNGLTYVKKVISEVKRISMIGYSIFDVLGPKGSNYRVVPGLNNSIIIQMTPKVATRSSIEISDVFFTNASREVVSVKDATTEDVIAINDSEDDVSVSDASDSGEDPVIVDDENKLRGSIEDKKNSEGININKKGDSNDHRFIKKDSDSNGDRDISEHIDIIEDLDSSEDTDINEDNDSNEEQDDLVAEIEQYMQEEDLLDELEQEIETKTQ